jgi:ATP phosphoribosyltransferase
LKENGLRIVETIAESVTVIVANRKALRDPWKKAKMAAIGLMLKGALDAKAKVLLKLNCEEARLPGLLAKLPALHSPTVNHLAETGWVAIETIVDGNLTRTLIPELKSLGGEGIVELPLNKVIP